MPVLCKPEHWLTWADGAAMLPWADGASLFMWADRTSLLTWADHTSLPSLFLGLSGPPSRSCGGTKEEQISFLVSDIVL